MSAEKETTGSNMECIAWLSRQPEGVYEVRIHEDDGTDAQRKLYWKVVGIISNSLREPKAYVHNYCLRLAEYYDGLNYLPFKDTTETELKIMCSSDIHYKPTHETYKKDGVVYRFYRKLRGLSGPNKLSISEMSFLLDLAINQMTDMGLSLPTDEATMKALEEHKKIMESADGN